MFLSRSLKTFSSKPLKKGYSMDLANIPLSSFFPQTPELDRSVKLQTKVNQLKETVLENGVTVKSEEFNPFGPTVVSIVAKFGPRNESYRSSGVSHFIQKFFFDNTNLRTKLRLCSEFEKTGATITSSVGREEIVYRTEGLEESLPKVFELMADSIFNGRLHSYDLPPKKKLVKNDIEVYSEVPEIVLNEALHRTAFARTLGNPIICPPHQLSKISTDTIAFIMNCFFNGENISVIGSNIPHETLVALTKEFVQINECRQINAPNEKENKKTLGEVSLYKGGDCRIHVAGEPAQAILAYEGVHNSSEELASFVVFAKLLGGTSFEGSDPTTKGRASLLNRKVMKGLDLVSGEAYHLTYSDAGLFAVHLKGSSESVGTGVFKTKELLNHIAEGGLPEKEVVRAKNQALLEFYSTFETNSQSNEFFIKFKSVDSFVEALKAVEPAQMQKIAKKLLKTPPTLVSYGDLNNVPDTFELKL